MARKPKAVETKRTLVVERQVEVNDQTSTLKVQIDFDMKKATYKIHGHLTTKQIDVFNNAKQEAVLKQLADMFKEAVQKAVKVRADLLDMEDAQLQLGEQA